MKVASKYQQIVASVDGDTFRLRKKYKIPAWAMTSIVPAVNESAFETAAEAEDWPAGPEEEDPGAGRIMVGPKTVARLWRDILLWGSYWFTLLDEIS